MTFAIPEQLYGPLISLVIAVVTYLISLIGNRKLKQKITSLEEFINSSETEYYIECPHCKHKIVLNKVKILVNKQDKDE